MYVLAPFSTEERNIYMDNVDWSTVFFSLAQSTYRAFDFDIIYIIH